MAAPPQRRSLGTLFLVLACAFAGIAYAAAVADTDSAARWVIAIASGVVALWFGGLALRTLRLR